MAGEEKAKSSECEHAWGSLMASYGANRRCVKCGRVEPLPKRAEAERSE